MANQNDCRSMREIMKLTGSRVGVVFYWGVIALLASVLIYRISEISFIATSHSEFVYSGWFSLILGFLCVASFLVGVFGYICFIVAKVRDESENVVVFFIAMCGVGIFFPLVGKYMLYLLSAYLPECILPSYLELLSDSIGIYGWCLIPIGFLACVIGKFF